MTLREKQTIFALKVADLIKEATVRNYQLTLGEVWRSPEEALRLSRLGKGIKLSLHTKRLAIDINLFKDGIYLTNSEDYKELGEWWESQSYDSLNFCWGEDLMMEIILV